jgi:membrane-associated phospholipid phosphatase
MDWLQAADVALFRFVNQTLGNPVLDVVMPFLSGNPFFAPALAVLGVGLLWKGGARGRLCVLMLVLVVALGDGLVVNTLKHALGRPRPFLTLPDVHLLVGQGSSGSLPSSHAASWFAASLIVFAYYRRSAWFMLPLASLVALSRVYVGVHYPSDIVAGAIIGAGYAAAGLWIANRWWHWMGQRWFPLWWQRLPSVVEPPPAQQPGAAGSADPDLLEHHWLRLGYLCIAVTLVGRLAFLASGTIELTKDEAYQWLWSKHLALSYYSKPPLIAWTQFLGTSLWGDTQFGVRFFSPVFAAALSVLILRFMVAVTRARAAFLLLAAMTLTPMLAVGSILMTVDPILVLFWTLALVLGWRAAQPDGTAWQWLGVGLATGLSFLGKYTGALLVACWGVFFLLWPPARRHLRRRGPYLALLILALCTLPVVIWNSQHGWITLTHLSENAALQDTWQPTTRYFWEFLGAEAGLLNPVFFVLMLWAMIGIWRQRPRTPLGVYLFAMGAPVFLGYWAYSLHSRIQPNWVAAGVIPLFCLAAIYWHDRFCAGTRAVKTWFKAGAILGFVVLLIMHWPEVVPKLTGRRLPAQLDPLRRARGWRDVGVIAGHAWANLLREGRPAFIIGDHYGMAGQISFHLPEARTNLTTRPLVYCRSWDYPENQFFFWPGYREQRRGESAVWIFEGDLPKLDKGWLSQWWRTGAAPASGPPGGLPGGPSERMLKEFEQVEDLGVFYAKHKGMGYRPFRVCLCRNLR